MADNIERELLEAVDVHPNSNTRINEIKKSIEHEIKSNKDLSPKMKKELQDELDRNMKQVDDIQKGLTIILQNKDEAIIACEQLASELGSDDSNLHWMEELNRDYMDDDFKNRLRD